MVLESRRTHNRDVLDPELGRVLAARFHVAHRSEGVSPRLLCAVYLLVNGFITIGILSVVATLSRTSFVFPSLGPTAMMVFARPTAPAAAPRHAVLGHAVGIACGYGALVAFGLHLAPEGLEHAITLRRGLAAALSLAATGAILMIAKLGHPPAGATTLIVSLGIAARPSSLIAIEVAVVALVLQALVINRLVGVPYPVWNPRPEGEPAAGPAPVDRRR